jgi:Rps23 Pro-64 3,4-dihydroxylase Tpa1-like proline 4-hydroxylase
MTEATCFTEPVTFCIIKNFYSKDELELIWKELENLRPHFGGPGQTGTARNVLGHSKKNNQGVFLPQGDPITILNRKLFTPELLHELSKLNWFFGYLKHLNQDSTLVSYYEDSGHYKAHTDQSVITAIHYLWKEPKTFMGGELYFGDFEVPIENNCLLIFPSCTLHEVKPLKGYGRYALTQFVSMREERQPEIQQFTNFLSILDFKRAQEFIEQGTWTTKGNSGGNSPVNFLYMNLENNKFFSEYLRDKILALTGRQSKLDRVYANGQYHGLDGSFHQDNKNDGTWTFLLYLTEIEQSQLDEFHGTTEIKMGDRIVSFQPETNSAILFPSQAWHRGRAPSRFFPGLRITVAWKFSI